MFVIAGILVLGFVILVHELGHFWAARLLGIRVSRFSIGFGPVLLSRKFGEVEYALRALPLGGFVAFPEESDDATVRLDDPNLMKNRPVLHRAAVVVAGVAVNAVCAFLLLMPLFLVAGIPEVSTRPGVLVTQVVSGGSASKAGMKPGTVLQRAGGQVLDKLESLAEVMRANAGRPVWLQVRRTGQTASAIQVMPDREGRIGVGIQQNQSVSYHKLDSPLEVLEATALSYQNLASTTFYNYGKLFTGKVNITQLSGPVGIVAVTAEAAQADWLNLFYIAALISFNLVVLNSLPLPGLDGGQMAFLAIEAVRGRPASLKVQQWVNSGGLLVLLDAGIFLILKDSLKLLGG